MDVHPTAKTSLSARLGKTNPAGVHICAYTTVTFVFGVLTHDMGRKKREDTYIGETRFIDTHSVILLGVRTGDQFFIAAR